jgi:SAM-dependent methyltransferase
VAGGQASETGRYGQLSARIDTTKPHPARRYDYWLGGKDNFAADRESGDAIAAAFPSIVVAARENRSFLRRAVAYLAGEAGVTQFLDIGTGLPTQNCTHEIAQQIDPTARVVYVDNDPIVLAHARALLTSGADGATAYIDEDLRNPGEILDNPDLSGTLDLTRPVALMLVAVMHFIVDADDPHRLVRTLVDRLPSGSYLVMTHATWDFMPADQLEATRSAVSAGPAMRMRSRDEIAQLLDGLELVEPGIVPIQRWRCEDATTVTDADVAAYGVVARKP